MKPYLPGYKLVVLDDDPTGVQTVHDVSVYTDWSLESIQSGFEEPEPLFFLLNSYTTGLQPAVLQNLLRIAVQGRHGGRAEAEELVLPVRAGGTLPCGASGRWTAEAE